MSIVAPDARQVLVARLAVQYENLRRARELVGSIAIDDELRAAVRVRFESLLDRQRSQLDQVRAALEAGHPDSGWHLLRAARADSPKLHNECLSFVQGALARTAGLDGGTCALADHLLGELSARTDIPWSRLTIPGAAEMVDVTADILRLTYTDAGIWRLPIMAHEFGHLVVSKLERPALVATKPLEAFVERIPEQRMKLRELCGDVFGVFAMGPAFAATAIVLEFDPGAGADEPNGATHPSDAKRAYAVTAALARLDEGPAGSPRPFGPWARSLATSWAAARAAAGGEGGLTDETRGEIDLWVASIWQPLAELLPRARYTAQSWARALRLAGALGGTVGRPGDLGTPARDALARGDTLIDVLNAAWSARLHRNATEVEPRARDMATAVAAG